MGVNESPKTNFLVVDIETTGFPDFPSFGKWYAPSNLEAYRDARVVKICCVSETQSWCWFVSDGGVPTGSAMKYRQEIQTLGRPFCEIIDSLIQVVAGHDKMIGNNILFVVNVLASEMFRWGKYEQFQTWMTICWEQLDYPIRDVMDIFVERFHYPFISNNTVSYANAIWDIYMHKNRIEYIPKSTLNKTILANVNKKNFHLLQDFTVRKISNYVSLLKFKLDEMDEF